MTLMLQEINQAIPTWLLDWVSGGILQWSGWGMFLYLMIMTHITIASVTIFLHRHQAHRALDLSLCSTFFSHVVVVNDGYDHQGVGCYSS